MGPRSLAQTVVAIRWNLLDGRCERGSFSPRAHDTTVEGSATTWTRTCSGCATVAAANVGAGRLGRWGSLEEVPYVDLPRAEERIQGRVLGGAAAQVAGKTKVRARLG